MGKFNNIISYNNIDVLNEYRITDYSYPLAKVRNNESLILGSNDYLYTELYGKYVSINSYNGIDIITGVGNEYGYDNLFITLISGHVHANTQELIVKDGNSNDNSILNVYGDTITRYHYKFAYTESGNEEIVDAFYLDTHINKIFIGSIDKNKYGHELWMHARHIAIYSERDSDTIDSNTTEGAIDIHCYNLKTTSTNKSDFVSSYEMYITSNNSFIQSRAYKNNIIAAYTNERNSQSTICLYGNNAGIWGTSDIGSGNKTGDVYIKTTKNLYTSSIKTLITSTEDSEISAGKDITIQSNNSFETASGENTIVKSHKNIEIKTYTDTNDTDSNASNIILYGNDAGNYDFGALPWSGYLKVGDIYIRPKKNLNVYSSMFYLYTTASIRIKSYNDTTIESTNSYIKFEAANGVILGNNNKHYGTTLPTTNNTEGRIFFQIIN